MNFTLDLEQLVENGVSFEKLVQEIVVPQLETEYKRIGSANARIKKFQKAQDAVLSDSYTYADLEVLKAHLDEKPQKQSVAEPKALDFEEFEELLIALGKNALFQ